MGSLFFQDSKGNLRIVDKSIDEKDVPNEITHFAYKLNPKFQIYYIRTWEDPGTQDIVYDVGSHTEFFRFKEKCCANCKYFLGGGDFGTCCSKTYNLFYEYNICEDWESKK